MYSYEHPGELIINSREILMNSYEIPGELIINSREILMISYEIPMNKSAPNRPEITPQSSPN